MFYGFRTKDQSAGAAALLVYAVYRSRNRKRGPSGIDMWGQIERFTKVSAKRAISIGSFLETFKRKMACETINPKWCESGSQVMSAIQDELGNIIVTGNDTDGKNRQFLTEIMESGKDQQILYELYKETARVIMLVRDRLEREKPIEHKLEEIIIEEEN